MLFQVSVLPVVQAHAVEMGNVRRANASVYKGSQAQTAASVYKELNATKVSEIGIGKKVLSMRSVRWKKGGHFDLGGYV